MSKETLYGTDDGAQITRRGALDCQACIPDWWTDEQAKAFADRENLCGTEHGWHIRRAGDPALNGDPERNPCQARPGFVHLMFDA